MNTAAARSSSLALALSVMLAAPGCSNFTEYTGPPEAGLTIIDPESLQIIGTLDGVPGGRALCSGSDGVFFVSSSTGRLYCFNSETILQDTSFVIGPGSSAGYGSMAFIPWKGSLYIIGATGSILEVSVAERSVVDEITPTPSSSFLAPSRTFSHLYVNDTLNRQVHSIQTSTNLLQKSWNYPSNTTTMVCNTRGSDTLLISTDDPDGRAFVQPVSYSSYHRTVSLPATSDFAVSLLLDLVFAAHPDFGSPSGSVSVIDSLSPINVRDSLVIPGNPTHLAVHGDGRRFFILSDNDYGGCTLFSYTMAYHASFLGSVDLPGTPADMIMAGDRLVILTY